MNKQTEALMMAKQHIIERKGGRGGAVCYVKSDEDVIKAIDEALAQPAQEPDRTGMVYYKNNACKAKDANSPDCICWTPEQPAQEYLTRAQQVIRANNSAQEHCVNLKMDKCEHKNICKHCTHPAPSWQGLSDDEIFDLHHKWIMNSGNKDTQYDFARAIERALKEKNAREN